MIEQQRADRHEYKIVSGSPKTSGMLSRFDWTGTEETVNSLVADGWEVVSSSVNHVGLFVVASGGFGLVATFVLRRPLPH